MKNIFLALSVTILSAGCASYQGRTVLVPQQSPAWKQKLGTSIFRTQCKEAEVEVSDVILSIDSNGYTLFYLPVTFDNKAELAKLNKKGAALYLMLINDTFIEACHLTDMHLEEVGSGESLQPKSVEKTSSYKDDRSKKYTTYCAYYFELKNDPLVEYDLHISKEVLHCEIKPIRYRYKKGYFIENVELM